MKRFSLFLPALAVAVMLLSSCQPKTDATMETPPLPDSDFKLVTVIHDVKDFEQWKAIYMSADSVRTANDMIHVALGRGKENPNRVLVAHRINDVEKTKAYLSNPETMARMDSAGVTNPEMHYIHVVRWDTASVQGKDRALAYFRVKDFNAWLQKFDAEGRDFRVSHGFGDRGIGRGIDDPNMVYVNFYINDPAKVGAFMQSEEFAKIKTDSGVQGDVAVFNYTAE